MSKSLRTLPAQHRQRAGLGPRRSGIGGSSRAIGGALRNAVEDGCHAEQVEGQVVLPQRTWAAPATNWPGGCLRNTIWRAPTCRRYVGLDWPPASTLTCTGSPCDKPAFCK